MKKNQIIYYVSTGLLTLLMLFSSGMYFFNYEKVVEAFQALGFPTYIIYPLAVAKISGLIALWFINNKSIKEWAYAGFFFNLVLAFFAHVMVGDGEQMGALIGFVLLVVSYFFRKKIA